MSRYMIASEENQIHLAHYGVKGMKWKNRKNVNGSYFTVGANGQTVRVGEGAASSIKPGADKLKAAKSAINTKTDPRFQPKEEKSAEPKTHSTKSSIAKKIEKLFGWESKEKVSSKELSKEQYDGLKGYIQSKRKKK